MLFEYPQIQKTGIQASVYLTKATLRSDAEFLGASILDEMENREAFSKLPKETLSILEPQLALIHDHLKSDEAIAKGTNISAAQNELNSATQSLARAVVEFGMGDWRSTSQKFQSIEWPGTPKLEDDHQVGLFHSLKERNLNLGVQFLKRLFVHSAKQAEVLIGNKKKLEGEALEIADKHFTPLLKNQLAYWERLLKEEQALSDLYFKDDK